MRVTRADELDALGAIAGAFARAGSPRVVASCLLVAVAVRAGIARWSWLDVGATAVIVVAVGPVEWLLHRRVLHASPDSWTSRRLGTGAGHREHHLDPPELRWLLLGPVEALVLSLLLAVVVAGVFAGSVALIGGGAAGAAAMSGVVVALAALLHYEWTHLLIHTRYRPRTRRYQRLARNHRLHHFRNEEFWLGVTSNVGDRLRSTVPANRSAVPLSETARTLR